MSLRVDTKRYSVELGNIRVTVEAPYFFTNLLYYPNKYMETISVSNLLADVIKYAGHGKVRYKYHSRQEKVFVIYVDTIEEAKALKAKHTRKLLNKQSLTHIK